MTTTVTLHFPFAPVAWARAGVSMRRGRPVHYTTNETRAYEKAIADSARVQLGMRFVPWTGPIRTEIVFGMPIPTSLSKRKRAALDGTPHFVKPDRDNLEKALLDGLSEVLWVDDAQVCAGPTDKWYCLVPFVSLTATRIETP